MSYNSSHESLVFTLAANGKQQTITFPPGTAMLQKYQNNSYFYVSAFQLNNQLYVFKNARVHNNIAAQYIKDHAVDIGQQFGASEGRAGVIIGTLIGLSVSQIASHFSQHIHDSGYYSNGQLIYEGPVGW